MAVDSVTLESWRGVPLWLCPLHHWPSPDRQAWLDGDERARAARFLIDVHRRRYVAAHVWLRAHLGAWLGVPPQSLRFGADAQGKPRLDERRTSHFNLSHSGDWALIGASADFEIGVDIEVLRRLDDAPALAQRHYTRSEQAACQSSEPADDRVFLGVWTRKEACMKATGMGLRLAPASFEVGAAPGAGSVCLSTPLGPQTIEVLSIETGIDAVAAVARVVP